MRYRLRRVLLLCAVAALVGCAARVEIDGAGDVATPPAVGVVDTPEAPAADGLLDEREWNAQLTALLRQYVHPHTGIVDYAGLRQDLAQLRALVESLVPARTFESDRHRLAFLLNAYNACVLLAVAEHAPVSSPRSIEGFYGRRKFDVLGGKVTLDAMRDQMIRPLDDPRAHMAMCNAAHGAPPLRNEAYTVERLDGQLNEQCRRFVASPAHNTQLGGLLLISSVFEWFGGDFDGPPFHGPVGFLRIYADDHTPIGRLLATTPNPPVEHMDFNWALNGRDAGR